MIRRFRLPNEIPLEEYPKPEEFVKEAVEIVNSAKDEKLTLRVMGGMAVYMHSKEHEALWNKLGRLGQRVFTDIDLAGYGKQRDKYVNFLRKRGYEIDNRLLMYYGKIRQIYYGPRIPMVEIFLDRLSMNHVINFEGRLEMDPVTIPLAELLLEKLQIVKINDKDIKDVIVLLRAHDLGYDDNDKINLGAFKYQGLFDDWGFWYTVTTNLKLVAKKVDEYGIPDEDKRVVLDRIEKLLKFLEEAPKSKKWEKRAAIGTKEKWYTEVEEWH
jgi:hypothetical protein